MMTYFASYIPFYAWIVAPLFSLLRKNKEWSWTETEQNAFELAKEALTSAPVMAYPIVGKPYRLYTDACDYGLGAVLQQVQPIKIKDLKGTKVHNLLKKAYEEGKPVPRLAIPASKQRDDVIGGDIWHKDNWEETSVQIERVIAYWSRILKSAERNYSPTEREALALKEALVKFQVYLEGSEFIAITDHAALTWSTVFNNVNRRLATWRLTLAAYPGMHIVHRAGRVHDNADPVSRLRRRIPFHTSPLADSSTPLKLNTSEDPLKNLYKEIGDKFEQKVLEVASRHASALAKPLAFPVLVPMNSGDILDYQAANSFSLTISIDSSEVQKILDAYMKDPHFKEVLEAIRLSSNINNPPFPQYQVGENGLLYFLDANDKLRLCIPKNLQLEFIQEAHDELSESAHSGYAKTYNRIASLYYWPKMSKNIMQYVLTCDICQKAKPRRHGPRGYLQPIPIPTQPFEVLSMDFIMDLPKSNGFNAIYVIVDKLTKYAHFLPCTTHINEEETAQLFHDSIWCHYGLPRQVITDRDTRWTGAFWSHLVSLLGIKRALTTAHHPQADGQTEMMNQILEIAIRCFSNSNRDNWSKLLPSLAHAYNTSIHSATKLSPAYLLRGFNPLSPSNLLTGTSEHLHRPAKESETAIEFAEQMQATRTLAKDCMRVAQSFQERSYNSNRQFVIFEPGDLVLINPHSLELLKHKTGKGKKLTMRYEGPFEIMERVSPVAYRLRLPASYQMHPVINIAHLESYKQSPEDLGKRPTQHIPRDDFEIMPEYEIEKIVDERLFESRGKKIRKYKIRWLGYGPQEDEWKTEKELRNAPDILRNWKINRAQTLTDPSKLLKH
ncbi:Retrovirus-related Pol polyprotein [Ceratobasidium theobromae]|uniref:Retrovirus-related Pol polyprotein n=1 Tax=Ceratobasidium theobromae TaxID=1582974 RepID=A0A5N5Q7L5_9AGAM|nr:Retrovirus-related Pol polyprotein [Ceratobasidium theobromae]